MKQNISSLARAKNIIFRLLKTRFRSEKEVSDRLKQKQIPPEVITEAIDYFKQLDLINDRQFAKRWIQARLAKPFGINRIRFELKEKGIKDKILQEELTIIANEFSEEEVALQLAEAQRKKYSELDPLTIKRRVLGYLLRRGFTQEASYKAIRNYDSK